MSFGGGQAINVGGIVADLSVNSTHLERGLSDARRALAAIARELENLDRDFQQGALTAADYANRVGALTQTHTTLTNAMNAAYSSTTQLHTGLEIINAGAGRFGSGSSRAAMGVMQLSYAIDDLQYSFAATVNNIGPIVYMMSGNAGLAAAAQISAVGINVLANHWDELMASLGSGVPVPALDGLKALDASLKAINKEIDDLRKKSFLSDVQLGNLESAGKMLKGLETTQKEEKSVSDMNGPDKEDRDRGAAFVDAIREQGGGDMVRGVLAEEYKKRAEGDEGSNLNDAEIDALMKREGIYSADGGLDPGILKDAKHFNRERMNALARSLGLNTQFDDEDDTQLARGKDAQDIIRDRLRSQRFLFDDVTGQMMTPDQMARSNLFEGGRGNAVAAGGVGGVLDRRFGQRTTIDTANGKVEAFTPSVFSQNFNESSPEGKERAANRKAELDAIEKQRKLTEKEEDERQDLIINEAEASGKRNSANRRKNAQRRRQNERDSREASPGIDTIAEYAAGQARLGNVTPAQAQDEIKKYLMEHGRTDRQAGAAAEDIFAESSRKVEAGVIQRAFGSHKGAGNVAAFSGDELAAKAQASVGGGKSENAETNDILRDMRKSLDKLADKSALTVRFQ